MNTLDTYKNKDEHTWSYSKMIIQNTDIDQICMR